MVGTPWCLCGNSLSHFIRSCWPLCMVLSPVMSTLLVFWQIRQIHFINWTFHCSVDWTSLFSSPFAMEPVRFSAVVADLIAREPEVFCRKLCVYLECVTGAKEMAGIMGFIYVHTNLHCPVSGTLTRGTRSCWETSLVPLHIETVFTSHEVNQRDYSNWMTGSYEKFRYGHQKFNKIVSKLFTYFICRSN